MKSRRAAGRLLVAGTFVRDLLLCAKDLCVAAILAGPPASRRISQGRGHQWTVRLGMERRAFAERQLWNILSVNLEPECRDDGRPERNSGIESPSVLAVLRLTRGHKRGPALALSRVPPGPGSAPASPQARRLPHPRPGARRCVLAAECLHLLSAARKDVADRFANE
jgi:hypothetical protein